MSRSGVPTNGFQTGRMEILRVPESSVRCQVQAFLDAADPFLTVGWNFRTPPGAFLNGVVPLRGQFRAALAGAGLDCCRLESFCWVARFQPPSARPSPGSGPSRFLHHRICPRRGGEDVQHCQSQHGCCGEGTSCAGFQPGVPGAAGSRLRRPRLRQRRRISPGGRKRNKGIQGDCVRSQRCRGPLHLGEFQNFVWSGIGDRGYSNPLRGAPEKWKAPHRGLVRRSKSSRRTRCSPDRPSNSWNQASLASGRTSPRDRCPASPSGPGTSATPSSASIRSRVRLSGGPVGPLQALAALAYPGLLAFFSDWWAAAAIASAVPRDAAPGPGVRRSVAPAAPGAPLHRSPVSGNARPGWRPTRNWFSSSRVWERFGVYSQSLPQLGQQGIEFFDGADGVFHTPSRSIR